MNKKYLLLILTIITISSVGITHAINPVQEDKKRTGVLFQATNMNVTTTVSGWELVDLGKSTAISDGMIFFSERYVLLNGEKHTVHLDSFGNGIIVGGKSDGNIFQASTLSSSNTYGLVELIFHGKCDYDGIINPTNPEIVITWKQASNDLPQIIDIKPTDTSSFSSICQTP